MQRFVLIDDDLLFADIIKHYVDKVPDVELVSVFTSASEALASSLLSESDFVFLDIELPEMTGLELMEVAKDGLPPVVMVSSKKEYGADSYNYNVIDYLHKPISFKRFVQSLEKIKHVLAESSNSEPVDIEDAIFLKIGRIYKKVKYASINSIKASNNAVIIRGTDGELKSTISLTDLAGKLPSGDFMQVHRSYIVNLKKIDRIDGEIVEVAGRSIPVSRSMMKELYDKLHISR